ncbi:TOX high mobility group box family member 3-like [Anthonomus grandis grandis]|uniref:TOX high mobility group box family member 3-like n=1 Tax=Anthonomus grandis grandis TaxID=2921223 RepID=UPI002165DFE3|nr:TOX high mobility group box family member 3-like [Anthonomus grandis grandis]
MKMISSTGWLPFLITGIVFVAEIHARKIRVQPRLLPQEEADESIQYYAAEPQESVDNRQRVVLVSSADQYNGLYGQQNPSSRRQDEGYNPRGSAKPQYVAQRVKEVPKDPPVQTIRNYNKVNDDGSFTFGYEAADGSFKEETRGTDCVVRGKYGYIDPDGNKREFNYVSGNPCDPNAPKEEEEDEAPESDGPENIPANYPSRPIRPESIPANYPSRPIRPIPRPVSTVAPKPVTLFQNKYEQTEEEQPEPEQILRPTPTPVRSRPQYISRPQYVEPEQQIEYRPRPQAPVPSSTPVSTLYRQHVQPITITPRPVLQTAAPTIPTRAQLPATTYRPQQSVSVTPRPALLYTPKNVAPTPAPNKAIDFDAEFQRFQQENNFLSPTAGKANVGQIYNSALVYDPTTGQYKNQLYQTLPQSEGQFSFNQRIQPYVHTAQQQKQVPTVSLQQLQPQNQATYRQQVQQINPQAAYHAQQAELQFQNSAQLYAQQQKAREQQQQQRQYVQSTTVTPAVYYIQPSADTTGALGAGQIDAFLRGHNIRF